MYQKSIKGIRKYFLKLNLMSRILSTQKMPLNHLYLKFRLWWISVLALRIRLIFIWKFTI